MCPVFTVNVFVVVSLIERIKEERKVGYGNNPRHNQTWVRVL